MIHFICPECGKKLSAHEKLLGKRIKCPGCGGLAPVARVKSGVAVHKSGAGQGGPSALLLIAGLVLGLGGLVGAFFIYQVKQARDAIDELRFQRVTDTARFATEENKESRSITLATVCGARPAWWVSGSAATIISRCGLGS